MGGCSWNYFVLYEVDVSAALQKLRSHIFRTGQYTRSVLSAEDIAEEPELAQEDPNREPETIDKLLEQEAEDGTNSILDITHLSDQPEFAAATPVSRESLREIFGTDQPTHEMVESKRGYPELLHHSLVVEKWQGAYFTVYRDDKPDEIFFFGCSGDH
jgi:hypothetical protein